MTTAETPPQRAEPAQPASSAWTLFRVRGVPVLVDRSWLLLGAWFGWIAYGQLSQVLHFYPSPVVLALSVVAAALLFVSILAHELGHALTSLDRSIPVRSITMFALGGVTESTREASRARDEFVIVGIGPFISLVLAAAFGLIATFTTSVPAVSGVTGLLGWTNLLLAVFNFVPGYPLDGGRLLRSVFWGATGRPHQATRWAARVGQVFAGAVIAWSLYDFALGAQSFLGLWNVLIGYFLFRGATASHRRAKMLERAATIRVADLMGNVPPALPANMSLRDALEQVQQRPSLLWPVGDPLRGTLLMTQIDAVPNDRWDTTTVGDVALDPADSSVDVDAPVDDAVARMQNSPDNMLVVTDRGRPVGLLTPSLLSRVP